MKLVKMVPRSPTQERKLAALWKRLANDDKRMQATRDAIDKFLNSERLKFVPVDMDD